MRGKGADQTSPCQLLLDLCEAKPPRAAALQELRGDVLHIWPADVPMPVLRDDDMLHAAQMATDIPELLTVAGLLSEYIGCDVATVLATRIHLRPELTVTYKSVADAEAEAEMPGGCLGIKVPPHVSCHRPVDDAAA